MSAGVLDRRLDVAAVAEELRLSSAHDRGNEWLVHEAATAWILALLASGMPDDLLLADIRTIAAALAQIEDEQEDGS